MRKERLKIAVVILEMDIQTEEIVSQVEQNLQSDRWEVVNWLKIS